MDLKLYDTLIKYAKSIDNQNASDLVHDAYLKIIESGKDLEEIEVGYYILTIRSIFLDKYRKDKHQNTIFYDDYDMEIEAISDEIKQNKSLDLSILNPFEKLLINSLFGVEIFNQKAGIMEVMEGCNMLQLSKDSKIPYITIRKAIYNIKDKLKNQLNDYEY